MSIEMQPVGSSNIAEIGYDAARRLLRVRFTNNALYEYQDVPEAYFHNLRTATSVGRYFGNSIKNVYECTKIESGKPKDPAKQDERTRQLDELQLLERAVIASAIDAADAYSGKRGHLVVPDRMSALVDAVAAYQAHPLALKLDGSPSPFWNDRGEPSSDGARS